jgi:small subunit ribosomal protein S8
MSMSDPIADFLTRIRNAIKAEKKTVDIPSSKLKIGIAEILKNNSFIHEYSVIEKAGNKNYLSLKLKYNDGISVIGGLKKISKPGIRRYIKSDKIPRVRNGLGIAIVSTSKGIMTGIQAKKLNVGGEVICTIW